MSDCSCSGCGDAIYGSGVGSCANVYTNFVRYCSTQLQLEAPILIDVTGHQFGSPNDAGVYIVQNQQIDASDGYNAMLFLQSTNALYNQPHLRIRDANTSTALGKGAHILAENFTGGSVDFEMIANNTAVDDLNGKFEIGAQPSSSVPGNRAYGGLWYLASRNAAGTAFERQINIFQLRLGGIIETVGEGLEITPAYTNTGAGVTVTNAFSNANLVLDAAAADARIDLNSHSTGDTLGFWRLSSSNANGRLIVRNLNTSLDAAYFDPSNLNRLTVFDAGTAANGAIRFGNGSTPPRELSYTNTTTTYNFAGPTGLQITAQGSRQVAIRDLQAVASVSGGTTAVTANGSDCYVLLNTAVLMAAYTITLPTTPPNGYSITILSRSGVTALTVNSADGGATLFGAPATLAANDSARMIYRTTGNQWWRADA